MPAQEDENARSTAISVHNPGRHSTPARVREFINEAFTHPTDFGRKDTSVAVEGARFAHRSKLEEEEGNYGSAATSAKSAAEEFQKSAEERHTFNERFRKEGMSKDEQKAFLGHQNYADKVGAASETFFSKAAQLQEVHDAREAAPVMSKRQQRLMNNPRTSDSSSE